MSDFFISLGIAILYAFAMALMTGGSHHNEEPEGYNYPRLFVIVSVAVGVFTVSMWLLGASS